MPELLKALGKQLISFLHPSHPPFTSEQTEVQSGMGPKVSERQSWGASPQLCQPLPVSQCRPH